MFVVTQEYRKDRQHPPGWGYGRTVNGEWVGARPGRVTSLIVHSTNGRKGSSFHGEATFLMNSRDVGCTDLIGKMGQIASIMPDWGQPWHSGATIPGFSNPHSYGIELHHAKGDTYPTDQMDALTWRVKQLIRTHGIVKEMIETHRTAAIPDGRKEDPSDWSDEDFYEWRDGLYLPVAPLPPGAMVYLMCTIKSRVRQGPSRSYPTALIMPEGTVAGYDAELTQGESIGGNSLWAHRADLLGFVHTSLLVPA